MDQTGPRVTTRNLHTIRLAVRNWLETYDEAWAGQNEIVIAMSGGGDSTALCAAAALELPGRVRALTIDHGLQSGSDEVAARAAQLARDLGCVTAEVLRVEVGNSGGLEAAARQARYQALDQSRRGSPVLVAHTLDDQAETVLLGLARGSGARSLAGMRAFAPPWGRPLLGIRRSTTRAACAEIGVTPHEDPHNSDARFTRVRLRSEVLPLLEEVLGGGVAESLARTAMQLQDDVVVLDALAIELLHAARTDRGLDTAVLSDAPAATRRRAIRFWLLDNGARTATDGQLRAIDALVREWRGQGPVAVPNGGSGQGEGARLMVERRHGTLGIAVQLRHSVPGGRRIEKGT
ncbi:tRNA lysidine(34) synthetase TilS [Hoyosella altamirensis]|uniref:tRNA lysidine(34) synthetase TilS n=1 Tax=Hoyosella altamirensis TaxID=616997 RepID=UPI0007DB2104